MQLAVLTQLKHEMIALALDRITTILLTRRFNLGEKERGRERDQKRLEKICTKPWIEQSTPGLSHPSSESPLLIISKTITNNGRGPFMDWCSFIHCQNKRLLLCFILEHKETRRSLYLTISIDMLSNSANILDICVLKQ